MIGVGDKLKITKVETFMVKPRWLFLKIHTNAGITGLGEPIVEGRAKTVATAIEELTPYLVGKDPRPVAHHWQAMYRHAFYRAVAPTSLRHEPPIHEVPNAPATLPPLVDAGPRQPNR